MIKSLRLKNFTAFTTLEMTFSPGINIIIGENGTGKTQLLKAAYAVYPEQKKLFEMNSEERNEMLSLRIKHLYLPLDDKLGKLHHNGAKEIAEFEIQFNDDSEFSYSFYNNSRKVKISDDSVYKSNSENAVFIPTKEVLSFMLGFTSLYDKYGLTFDQTYKDICVLLDLPKLRSDVISEKSSWAIDEIKKACGGEFIFYGGGKVDFKSDNIEYSANSTAEGFRKLGMLSRLLETGSIQPGKSGPLFWDEPEANLNPKLMKMLVQVLLELSRNGQQIILATHDYVLLKWFDLLMDKEKGDQVTFHSLYRDKENGEVKLESANTYQQFTRNAIISSFSELYDREIDRSFGGK